MSRLSVLVAVVLASAAAPAIANGCATFYYHDAAAVDPVVVWGIGARQSAENEYGSSCAAPSFDYWGDGGSFVSAAQSFENGGLHAKSHVTAQAVFPAGVVPGQLFSASIHSVVQLNDSIDFGLAAGVEGYATLALLVTGGVSTSLASSGSGTNAFVGASAHVEVDGSYSRGDGSQVYVSSAVDEVAWRHLAYRYLVGTDPANADDPLNYDPVRGEYFNEQSPFDAFETRFYEQTEETDAAGNYTQFGETWYVPPALTGVYSVRVPVYGDRPTFLATLVDCWSFAGAATGDVAEATCDLGHSIYFGGLTGIFDRAGNPLTHGPVTSQSGFDYSRSYFNQPAAVPEPASWALLIAGFGLTGVTLRRRRTSAV